MSNENIVSEYLKITNEYKEKYGPNTLLLMQVGAFFEIYDLKNDDDEKFSNMKDICNLCQLNYSEKKNVVNGKQVLMAGFRDYSLDKYIQKILGHNYTIIVYIQEKYGKGFRRVLDEIYSPGTFLQNDDYGNISNNTMSIWMEDVSIRNKRKIVYGISVINIVTGKSYIYEYETPYLFEPTSFDDLERIVSVFNPSEIIFISNFEEKQNSSILQYIGTKNILIHNPNIDSEKCKNCMKQTYIHHILQKFFGSHSQYNCFEFDNNAFATQSLCYLLDFMQEHNSHIVKNIAFPLFNNVSNKMILANHTLKQLNIIDSENSFGPYSSVLKFTNKCCSNMGKRLFQYELTNPVFDEEWLQNEYNSIEILSKNMENVFKTRSTLSNIYDMERINRQIYMSKAYPNDIFKLYSSLLKSSNVYELVDNIIFENYGYNYENLKLETSLITNFLHENLVLDKCKGLTTLTNFDDNIIQRGVCEDLDITWDKMEKNEKILNKIHEYLNELMKIHANEKSETIKIHETEKSGRSLQMTLTRSNKLKKIISEIDEKKKNIEILGTKFSLDEITFEKTTGSAIEVKFPLLQKIIKENMIIQNEINRLIIQSYDNVMSELKKNYMDYIINICNFICKIDVLTNKCYISEKYNYVKPEITSHNQSFVKADGLRHCLIEHLQTDETYVTNDIVLGKENQNGILLYGVNASGKTSFIRSLGIATILAQSGMYVPCKRFQYKPYQSIYSRILGNDNLFKGMSTFAVEISELRVILKMANENSMILGDELCSGTETESALSIFVASMMHICKQNSSFIFATHFHEIVDYEEIKSLKTLKMYHMCVIFDKEQNRLIYDRKMKPGSGESIYGLEVCKSLHLDDVFLKNAYELRNKYFTEKQGELSRKTSPYNSKKIRSMCELCEEELSSEVHHIEYQKFADEKGYINGFHKNHLGNLLSVCESCHNKLHNENNIIKKKKIIKNIEII